MYFNARFMGMGFRQAMQWTVAAREAEVASMSKQRGIMNRMVHINGRLMSAGTINYSNSGNPKRLPLLIIHFIN